MKAGYKCPTCGYHLHDDAMRCARGCRPVLIDQDGKPVVDMTWAQVQAFAKERRDAAIALGVPVITVVQKPKNAGRPS